MLNFKLSVCVCVSSFLAAGTYGNRQVLSMTTNGPSTHIIEVWPNLPCKAAALMKGLSLTPSTLFQACWCAYPDWSAETFQIIKLLRLHWRYRNHGSRWWYGLSCSTWLSWTLMDSDTASFFFLLCRKNSAAATKNSMRVDQKFKSFREALVQEKKQGRINVKVQLFKECQLIILHSISHPRFLPSCWTMLISESLAMRVFADVLILDVCVFVPILHAYVWVHPRNIQVESANCVLFHFQRQVSLRNETAQVHPTGLGQVVKFPRLHRTII